MEENRQQLKDSIDFNSENVGDLFRKLFYPTLLGMVFAILFNITDGIFVGRGIGSEALAAINTVAPMFLISTGIGLMYGMGASVVASIHLSHGKIKAARIVVTQAVIFSSLLLVLLSAVALIFPDFTLRLFGCSDTLLPGAKQYMWGCVPFLWINAILCSAGFYIRLSGAPKYAMACSIIGTILNVILDYLFIFVFKWGLFGAAIASSIGFTVGSLMLVAFLFQKRRLIHFVPIKFTRKAMRLTFRNIGYMSKMGFPSMLSELAVACMMICGNNVFQRLAGDDGVAAFSTACYLFPVIVMIYNSIAESAQPIISYNYGAQKDDRVVKASLIALRTALIYGVAMTAVVMFFGKAVVSMFIAPGQKAFDLAAHGLPLFSSGLLPFAVNIIAIGYFQSVERAGAATLVTVMRGFVFMILCFILMPLAWGLDGAWLAVPAAELLTFILVAAIYKRRK
jgi:putative MATE family efflux protein